MGKEGKSVVLVSVFMSRSGKAGHVTRLRARLSIRFMPDFYMKRRARKDREEFTTGVKLKSYKVLESKGNSTCLTFQAMREAFKLMEKT